MAAQIKKPRKMRRIHDRLKLQQAMLQTHLTQVSFDAFKRDIRLYSKDLDTYTTQDKQNPVKWATFVDTILSLHPSLNLYEDHWPIQNYFDIYVKGRREKRKQRQQRAGECSIDKDMIKAPSRDGSSEVEIVAVRTSSTKYPQTSGISSQDQLKIRDKANSVRRNLKLVSEPISNSFPDITFSSSLSQGTTVGQTPDEWLMIDQVQSASQTLRSSRDPSSAASSTTANPGLSTTSPPLIPQNVPTAPVIVSCIQCDTSSIADPLYNARLREFVKDEKLLAALAMIGIRFDQHLDLILKMKRPTLEVFFVDHVPATKLDVCTKWRLLRLFVNHQSISADTITSSASLDVSMEVDTDADGSSVVEDHLTGDELVYITTPSSEDETNIVNYKYFDFRVSLQYAMQLDDDEDDALFGRLMDALVEKSCNHFLHPEPDAVALEKFIASICSVVPGQFEKYANYWPIRIYLRWFRRNIPAITPTYTKEEESSIFADVFSKKVLKALLRNGLTKSPRVDILLEPSLSQISASSTLPAPLTPTILHTLHTIEQIPCPKSSAPLPETHRVNHLPIRVDLACHEIHAYMHKQNLGELIPVLVHLGFRTDGHFTLLRKTMAAPLSAPPAASSEASGITFTLVPFEDTVDREVVLNSPMLSRLGDFQKFLLRIAFDIDQGIFHFQA